MNQLARRPGVDQAPQEALGGLSAKCKVQKNDASLLIQRLTGQRLAGPTAQPAAGYRPP